MEHPGEDVEPPFRFEIVSQHKDCLSRQLKEAVRIINRPGTLNSKGEFGACTIPRMVIEQGDYERKKMDIEEKRVNEDEDTKWHTFRKRMDEIDGKNGKRKVPEWMVGSSSQNPGKKLCRREEPKRMLAITYVPPPTTHTEESLEKQKKLLAISYVKDKDKEKEENLVWKVPGEENWPKRKERHIVTGKKGSRKLVMTVKEISQHFHKLESPASSPKRKNNIEIPNFQSPAKKRRNLEYENLRQYWDNTSGGSSTDENKKIKNCTTFGSLTGNLGSLSSGQSLKTTESEITSSAQLNE